jgi:hypothetical protein
MAPSLWRENQLAQTNKKTRAKRRAHDLMNQDAS